MGFVVVGLSHKTAPLEIREKLAAQGEKGALLLRSLREAGSAAEGMFLSTCNRVEAYLVSGNPDEAARLVKESLARESGVSPASLDRHVYMKGGGEAVAHVFRVASSLDSMVVGETQISGQMKDAFARAVETDSVGPLLGKLVQRALGVSKKVRTETGVGQQPVSVSYAAVLLAEKIFGDLAGTRVLLAGAGEMGALAARHLIERKVGEVRIVNRTEEKAAALALDLNAVHVPYGRFAERLDEVDIVIASTAADSYILREEDVREVMRRRKNRPMFFIDISVPRNIDPEIHHLENVYLYDIDHLQGIVDANKKEREREAKKAEAIVAEETKAFLIYVQQMDLSPTIRDLSKKFESIRSAEVEKYFPKEGHDAIDACTKAIVNKILHDPILLMKTEEIQEGAPKYSEILKKLFRLDSND
ncbi:MAG TPA: glutamyl-tRNA reductase [bacterium]|nr:glutamyl-tRNA reductase [bacterium]